MPTRDNGRRGPESETIHLLAHAQHEDRQRRDQALAALAAVEQQYADLLDAKRTVDIELALQHTERSAEVERLQRQSVQVREQLERRLATQAAAAAELGRRLSDLQQRQESQASIYLDEITLLRDRIVARSGSAAVGTAAHHRRFTLHGAHPLVEGLWTNSDRSLPMQELIMDAPLFTRTHYQPVFTANDTGEYQLVEFLALHDRNFVRAAYLALLRREPDPDGAAFYLQQVRSGISKSRILHQIMQSDEARKQRTVIHGLQSHLRVTRLCEAPIIGRLVSACLFLANVGAHLRDLRVLENHVIRIAEEAQTLHEANMQKLRSLSK